MPPQLRNEDEDEPNRPQGSNMRRVISESEISVTDQHTKIENYRYRKSSLIGYVPKVMDRCASRLPPSFIASHISSE